MRYTNQPKLTINIQVFSVFIKQSNLQNNRAESLPRKQDFSTHYKKFNFDCCPTALHLVEYDCEVTYVLLLTC